MVNAREESRRADFMPIRIDARVEFLVRRSKIYKEPGLAGKWQPGWGRLANNRCWFTTRHCMIFAVQSQSRAFSLVELVVVVALIGLLGTGAIVGLQRLRENANFRKAVRDLEAIDLAKQTWQQFHPNSTWPTNEVERWVQLTNWLGAAVSGIETPTNSGFFAYPGFSPDGCTYRLGDLTEPSSGRWNGSAMKRPL